MSKILNTSGCIAAAGMLLAGCATLPDDGKDTEIVRFGNLYNYRYCEIFLIGGDEITRDLVGGVYNTTGLNMTANQPTGCTDEMWAKVDTVAIKQQYSALGVFKNGPRYWIYDWIEMQVGREREFNGLRARWFADDDIPPTLEPVLALLSCDWGTQLLADADAFNAWATGGDSLPAGQMVSVEGDRKVHPTIGEVEIEWRGCKVSRASAPHGLWLFSKAQAVANAIGGDARKRFSELVKRTGGEKVLKIRLGRAMKRENNVLVLA